MDLTTHLHTLVANFWYFIPLFIFIALIKSPWFKGVMGEWQVNLLIKLFLNKKEYHLIKNVTLPTVDGSTQIDHIIVSKYGVFVLETKNMKGWIFGSATQKQWTQKIYKHTTKFQNPLHQNYKHVKTLEACLGIDKTCIFSVITFIGDCTFKTKMPDNVTYARGAIEYIKSHQHRVLTEHEVTSVIATIECGRLQRGFKTNRQHIKHVQTIIENKPSTRACTKCGAAMVLRTATRGKNAGVDFWGCSNFPKCRNVSGVE